MKKVLFTLCILLPLTATAQPYIIKHLGIKQGLSNNHVVSIAQDKRGVLWFATEEGLNQFDGVNFSSYYKGEFYQFNLSSCIRQQNSLTAQFVSFSLSNLANIFYPPKFLQ